MSCFTLIVNNIKLHDCGASSEPGDAELDVIAEADPSICIYA